MWVASLALVVLPVSIRHSIGSYTAHSGEIALLVIVECAVEAQSIVLFLLGT